MSEFSSERVLCAYHDAFVMCTTRDAFHDVIRSTWMRRCNVRRREAIMTLRSGEKFDFRVIGRAMTQSIWYLNSVLLRDRSSVFVINEYHV